MPIGAFDFQEFARELTMSYTPWWFFVFLLFVVVWYYTLPQKARWVALLAGSLVFCTLGGWQTLVAAVLVAFIAWNTGIALEAIPKKERKQRRLIASSVSIVLVGALAYFKLNAFYEWSLAWFVVPVGLSYYLFSVIAYLMDVYRGRQEAEHSFWRMLLFVVYFPKILEGPIERYGKLAPQLREGHTFDYVGFCHGMQLMIWGYIKKMVIADRIAVITTQAFGHHALYGGRFMLVCAMLAAFQLYCDFSGCMDIAGGISELFGIKLTPNFKQPFFSLSAAEFWRRWHITLGTWFKDYVYMPLTVSPRIMAVGKVFRDRFGRQAARQVIQVIPLTVVWILTGLWHGTGPNYVVWGIYWGVIIICSIVFAKPYANLAKKLRIDTKSTAWRVFQMARTFLLFSIGRIITMPGDLEVSWQILCNIVDDPKPWQLFDKTILNMGLSGINVNVIVIGILVVWIVDLLHEHGVHIRREIGSWNLVVREVVYATAVIAILVFGMYGSNVGSSAFAYAGF